MATTQEQKFSVQLHNVDEITPYENNPRINDGAVDAVAASLRDFGFRQPIVVDTDGIIIAGHTRYKAAVQLGLKKVPVHVATDLTAEQVRAYRLADNKTAELAEWEDIFGSDFAGCLVRFQDGWVGITLGQYNEIGWHPEPFDLLI